MCVAGLTSSGKQLRCGKFGVGRGGGGWWLVESGAPAFAGVGDGERGRGPAQSFDRLRMSGGRTGDHKGRPYGRYMGWEESPPCQSSPVKGEEVGGGLCLVLRLAGGADDDANHAGAGVYADAGAGSDYGDVFGAFGGKKTSEVVGEGLGVLDSIVVDDESFRDSAQAFGDSDETLQALALAANAVVPSHFSVLDGQDGLQTKHVAEEGLGLADAAALDEILQRIQKEESSNLVDGGLNFGEELLQFRAVLERPGGAKDDEAQGH